MLLQAALAARRGLLPAAATAAAAAAAGGAAAARFASAGGPAGVVDQMIGFARKEGGTAAVDVLRSGLAMQPDAAAGLDAARLLSALSELSGAQDDWAASAAQAAAAAAAAGDADSHEARRQGLAARLLQARALLAAGADGDAAAAAAAAAAPGAAPHPLPAALQLVAALAAGREGDGAQTPESSSGVGGAPDVLEAAASKLTGDALLLAGRPEDAEAAYKRAAAAAAAAAEAAAAGGDAGPLSHRFAKEVEADASLGLAQVRMAGKQWDAAEECLSAALKAAEAAGGEAAPLLAPVLCTLGLVYSRSARVMYAEGMFREAAKLARLDPSRLSVAPPSPALHPSAHAALAWRHCQLLTALPNRAGEAAAWEAAAHKLWARAGGGCGGAALEGVLGAKAALTGQGGHGGGWVAALLLRRLLVVAS